MKNSKIIKCMGPRILKVMLDLTNVFTISSLNSIVKNLKCLWRPGIYLNYVNLDAAYREQGRTRKESSDLIKRTRATQPLLFPVKLAHSSVLIF